MLQLPTSKNHKTQKCPWDYWSWSLKQKSDLKNWPSGIDPASEAAAEEGVAWLCVVFMTTSWPCLVDLSGLQSTQTCVELDGMWQDPWMWLSTVLELDHTHTHTAISISCLASCTHMQAYMHQRTAAADMAAGLSANPPNRVQSASIQPVFTSNEQPYYRVISNRDRPILVGGAWLKTRAKTNLWTGSNWIDLIQRKL